MLDASLSGLCVLQPVEKGERGRKREGEREGRRGEKVDGKNET